MIKKHNLADADQAIAFLKSRIKQDESSKEKDELIGELKKENYNLSLTVNSLRYENTKLLREINYFKHKYERKKFTPSIHNLRLSEKVNMNICAYCGRERMKKSFIRILANKNNYTVCKNCIEHVRRKFLVEDWSIGGNNE